MGITKTEGVFRRCCEFTLDALREEAASIQTILDSLRHDTLYQWSISPVRMAKLQNARGSADGEDGDGDEGAGGVGGERKSRSVNEPSEADRAIEVVKKKLSKTLSVMATVNDLINQATSVSNLAVLYSGKFVLFLVIWLCEGILTVYRLGGICLRNLGEGEDEPLILALYIHHLAAISNMSSSVNLASRL
jgi:hypothetical protein